MGLLSLGTALTWEDAKKYADHVRDHGITQLLHTWDRLKDRSGDELLWGDEVEYIILSLDRERKRALLSLRQSEILPALAASMQDNARPPPSPITVNPIFHQEYGRYMIESTPGAPYTGALPDLLSVERNMRYRRFVLRKHLNESEIPIALTSFPRLGVPGVFTKPYYDPANALASHSLFLPDQITNEHIRFPTLTASIRKRRGSKVAINLPIFFDEKTPRPFIDPTIPFDRDVFPEDPEAKNGAALPDHIYLDAMGFGMGCCCLQITFQACSVDEARRVYDGLLPITPIMLALTAASPAWRGYLADVDCRWNVISGSVDDRTPEERGLEPLKNSKYVIPKSRYASVDNYLSNDWINRPEYSDVPCPINEPIYQRLIDQGLDPLLAKHFAHLFIRDPLVIFSESIDLDDTKSTDHFENIQSTNWQTLRFKPPPPNSSIGWRVEFRPMEVQTTDFENAAFSVFIVLLSRAILFFGLNFYIPISKVDENMARAHVRGAARSGNFFFRKNVFLRGSDLRSSSPSTNGNSRSGSDCGECRKCGDEPNLSRTPSSTSLSSANSAAPLPGPGAAALEEAAMGHKKEARLRNCFPTVPPPSNVERQFGPVEEEYEEMTIEQIMCGKGDFPGLLGVVRAYVDSLEVEGKIKARLNRYLSFIERRANGSLMTTATWIRQFIRSHPAYKFDSVVSEEINYDLICALDEIERGVRAAPELLPEDYAPGIIEEPAL
ncbi:glutamate-cysteine ligase catalytic subunit [Auriculariales sp. MPI-PUGE-AT-0066]|nr:glutamate-cysteine ligase catalytic subunit [Auriculariales sp. MPI-PUGE-AT-0066]